MRAVVNTFLRPEVPSRVVVIASRSVVVDRPAPTPQWGLDCAFGLDLALHAFGSLPLNNKEWGPAYRSAAIRITPPRVVGFDRYVLAILIDGKATGPVSVR